MNCQFKSILLASAGILSAQMAAADEATLEARIAALEAMVDELKEDLAAERSERSEQIVRLEREAAPAPAAPASETVDGFRVGDAIVKVGGYADLDVHVTSLSDGQIAANSIARDFYIPGATPIGGEQSTATDFTAEASRIFLSGTQNVNGSPVTAYIEMDFLGSLQGDQRVSNSYAPRLRRAYIDYAGWRFGQEWSTFQNTSAIPESASFLILSDGMVFMRQALARYTHGNWQFAVENGNTTVTAVDGGRIEADSNIAPDVVARYNMAGDFGNVSLAGIARQLRYEAGAIEEEAFGYGLSASGKIKLGEADDLRFNAFGGEGLGRYVGLNAVNAAAIDPATGELEPIASYGGLVAWRHPFGETARFNIGYSALFADNPDFMPGASTKSVQSAYGAVLWEIAPQTTVGVELMHGLRETEAGAEGDITRATFSTKYSF